MLYLNHQNKKGLKPRSETKVSYYIRQNWQQLQYHSNIFFSESAKEEVRYDHQPQISFS